jgi:hypothetical protein
MSQIGRDDGPARTSTWQSDDGVPLAEHSHAAASWVRRGTMAVLLAVVLAASASLLGVRTGTATASSGGWGISLRYPEVARAGLDVQWQATVTHDGGFGKEVTLAVTGDYFNIYETQGFHPQPTDETRDGDTLYLTFTAPQGDTFVVDFDTYVQPASQAGSAARVAVVDTSTFATLAGVDVTTHLVP